MNIATINDRSLTIEQNDVTKCSSENRSLNNSKTDSTISRLGIPSLVIMRTASLNSKENIKDRQESLRPKSILSVVELSVEETPPSG